MNKDYVYLSGEALIKCVTGTDDRHRVMYFAQRLVSALQAHEKAQFAVTKAERAFNALFDEEQE